MRRSFGFPLGVSADTNVGRVRTNNEDSFGTAWLDDGSLFVIVADGMGGHEAGEVASGLAVQVVEDAVSRDPEADPRERLQTALIEANDVILDEGNRSGTRGMGTTAITAIFKGNEVYVALVGDSRLYMIRKGHVVWRTMDHTRVQMLVDAGEISDEEAKNHPEAGMLTRALGHARMADGRPLEPDVLTDPIEIQESDTLLLCSDGLTDLVDDWEIARICAGKTGDEAAAELIELACERGGHDNITIAIVNAGLRASDYDASYVPPNAQVAGQLEDVGTEDYDTYNSYDNPDGQHPAAAPPPAPAPAPSVGGSNLQTAQMVIGGPGGPAAAGGQEWADAQPAGNNKMLMFGGIAAVVMLLGLVALIALILLYVFVLS